MPAGLPDAARTARTGSSIEAWQLTERVRLAHHPLVKAALVLTILLIIIVLLLLFGGGWGFSRRGRRV
jgi:hypothetical protein